MQEICSEMYEEKLNEMAGRAVIPEKKAAAECRRRWDALAKPIDGLGKFENMVVKIAAAQGTPDVRTDRRAAVIMCADNGVTDEGVTQTDRSVTKAVSEAIVNGTSTVNVIAEKTGTDVFAVDIGIDVDGPLPGAIDKKMGRLTGNIAEGPAMSRETACRAVLAGIETAEMMSERGYDMLAAGEMGIGNTTPSSAIASVMLGMDPVEATGRGAGLSGDSYRHKIEVVKRAIYVNKPDRDDPIDVVSKIGGFDIAGMAGLYIGGAIYRIPVVADGLISCVAALLAKKICRVSTGYMLASHMGREPAFEKLIEALELDPVIHGGMALGEAAGAVMLFPLLDCAVELYRHGESFTDIEIESYERFR